MLKELIEEFSHYPEFKIPGNIFEIHEESLDIIRKVDPISSNKVLLFLNHNSTGGLQDLEIKCPEIYSM